MIAIPFPITVVQPFSPDLAHCCLPLPLSSVFPSTIVPICPGFPLHHSFFQNSSGQFFHLVLRCPLPVAFLPCAHHVPSCVSTLILIHPCSPSDPIQPHRSGTGLHAHVGPPSPPSPLNDSGGKRLWEGLDQAQMRAHRPGSGAPTLWLSRCIFFRVRIKATLTSWVASTSSRSPMDDNAGSYVWLNGPQTPRQ